MDFIPSEEGAQKVNDTMIISASFGLRCVRFAINTAGQDTFTTGSTVQTDTASVHIVQRSCKNMAANMRLMCDDT